MLTQSLWAVQSEESSVKASVSERRAKKSDFAEGN